METKTQEALKMAKQHIIERKGGRGGAVCYVKSDEEVIKAIDEALAQPAQEYLTRAQQVIRANNSAQEHVAWECFSDPAYYDMWAIRQVGNRNFEETIHVVNGKEAKQLCAWLNSLNIHTCVLTHSAPSFIGLSDDEVKIIQGGFCNGQYYVPDLVRAIEQALRTKNESR